MLKSNRKAEGEEADPQKILEQLEIELALKRAQRTQVKQRHGNIRALSFAFLAVVLFGAMGGLYFLMNSGRLQEMRESAAEKAVGASPSPSASAP